VCVESVHRQKTEAHDFPPKWQVVREFYQHDAKSLVKLAGLHLELEHRLKSVRQFESNWKHVTSWSEEKRYETHIDAKDARDLYRAITSPRNGVLVWLKKYW